VDTAANAQSGTTGALESRRLTVVVYADMAGYSRLIGEDDAGTCARLAELRNDLFDPALVRHGGRLVTTAGDSLLMLFDSILSAMRFAIEVQRAMPSFDGDHAAGRRIRFRMGVNVADVIPDGTNMHGDGLNIAARLQSICPVGAICVSRVVRDQVGNRLGLPFKELGAVALKNIQRPIEAFVLDPLPVDTLQTAPASHPRRRLAVLATLIGFAVLTSGLGLLFRSSAPPPAKVAAASQAPSANEPPPLSIAVLPFDNLSADPERTYLADGIAEDLTTDLVHLAGAFVISHKSAFSFRGKEVDIREIGRQLGVRYLLEGSVRMIGANVRINVQLIAAETGSHVWAEYFDKPIASLGEGQDDIVAHIASTLNVKLVDLDGARKAHAQSGSPAAFDLVLRAREALNEAPDSARAYIALGFYLQALRIDPNSVPAMAGAAAIFAGLFKSGDTARRAAKLLAAAEKKAVDAPDVVAAKFLVLTSEGRTREAFAMYSHLLDVNPSATGLILEINAWRSWWWPPEEELNLLDRTIRLNPRSANVEAVKVEFARTLLMLNRNDEALVMLERLVAEDAAKSDGGSGIPPSARRWQSLAKLFLAVAYVRAQRIDNAKHMAKQALQSEEFVDFTVRNWLRQFTRFYNQRGNLSRAEAIAADMRLADVPDHPDETADSGVPPTKELRDFTLINTPTPMTVPGGRTLTTPDVAKLLSSSSELPLVLSTLNRGPTVPGTIYVEAPDSGSLDDDWQPRLSDMMHDLIGTNMNGPIVVFGVNQNHWDAYNLVLRLVGLGYTNVEWYRGGWEAWDASGNRRTVLSGYRHL